MMSEVRKESVLVSWQTRQRQRHILNVLDCKLVKMHSRSDSSFSFVPARRMCISVIFSFLPCLSGSERGKCC